MQLFQKFSGHYEFEREYDYEFETLYSLLNIILYMCVMKIDSSLSEVLIELDQVFTHTYIFCICKNFRSNLVV